MLLILFPWVYILAISIILGLSINKSFKVFTSDSVVTIFLGFFGITLFTGFWAIFFVVNWQFHIVLFGITAVAFKLNGLAVNSYLENLKKEIKALSTFLKTILVLITILILTQCASPPFILDNESYYIQTIEWLNEYGFVKGLVNLHLFLGQTSGWHILQSAFSFSFIYDSFNDLSGLCLLLGNYYAIQRLHSYISNTEKSKLDLIIGLFPIFNVFLFQFIAAPSPDIAVYVIGLIVFYQFIESYTSFNKTVFFAMSLLTLFLVFIKLSTILFCVFPMIIFIKHYKQSKKHITPLLLFGSITLVLLIIKNAIITGNPIYPLSSIESLSFDWHLPKTIESYFQNYGLAYGYNLSPEVFENATVFERLKHWLLQPNLHGVFNSLMVLILVISPWFIVRGTNKKVFGIIYSVAVLNLLFLFTISPQYRFFFPFIMILSLILLSLMIKTQKGVNTVVSLGLLMAATPLCFTMKLPMQTEYQNQTTNAFKLKYVIEPHSNSQFETDFETFQLDNTNINAPTTIDFFWGTGNVPLPAVNKQQLEYFKTYFKVVPQQYSEDLKNGFYSKKLK